MFVLFSEWLQLRHTWKLLSFSYDLLWAMKPTLIWQSLFFFVVLFKLDIVLNEKVVLLKKT